MEADDSMNNASKKLLDELFNDKEYQEYISEFENTSKINLDKLKLLLNNHFDLYKLFLKTNILLYRYDTKLLEDDLKDFSQLNGETLYLDDADTVMNYYINNYKRCKDELHRICIHHWRPPAEKRIINKIINRKIEKEIKDVPESELD